MATAPNIPPAPDGSAAVPVQGAIPPAPDGSAAVAVQNQNPPSEATIGPRPGGVGQWLGDLESDVRTGGTMTAPGRVLHALGASGTSSGVSGTSPLADTALGPIHAAQGVANMQQHPVKGALQAAGGALEAGSIPLSFMAPEAAEKAAALPGKASALVDVKSVQPALKNGIKQVLSNVADELGVSKPLASLRDSAKELGDSVLSKSKEEFAAIDKATNGEFTNIDRALENLNREIRTRVGVSKDVDAALAARKVELEANMQKAMEAAKTGGVDPAIVDEARGNYKRAQALYDLDGQIKRAVPYTGEPAAQQANVKGLYTRLNKMLDTGRLNDAVGDEGAKQLMQHGEQAKTAAEQIAARAKLAKRVATGAGVGAAGALGFEGVHKYLGGK